MNDVEQRGRSKPELVSSAIGAPRAALTAFVLAHLSSREVFSAGTSALLAVKARLSPDELRALRLNDALSKLEGHRQRRAARRLRTVNLGRNRVPS